MSQIVLTADTLSTATAGAFEYDGKVAYVTPQGAQRGVIPGSQFYRLNSDYVGLNATGAQGVFGVGTGGTGLAVTLSSSTVYEFEMFAIFSKTAGTTSHTLAVGYGGTATINNILVGNLGGGAASAQPVAYDTAIYSSSNSTTAVITTSAITSATRSTFIKTTGTVSINAGGTFIPQYTLSAAPGGAYSTLAGSYFYIYPISTSGAATNVGTWS